MTAMFVNLPVTDLERAKAFHTAIGFSINFTDRRAARVVVEDGHSYFMIMVRDYFQSFTDGPGAARLRGEWRAWAAVGRCCARTKQAGSKMGAGLRPAVELRGLEPLAFWMQTRRSSS